MLRNVRLKSKLIIRIVNMFPVFFTDSYLTQTKNNHTFVPALSGSKVEMGVNCS